MRESTDNATGTVNSIRKGDKIRVLGQEGWAEVVGASASYLDVVTAQGTAKVFGRATAEKMWAAGRLEVETAPRWDYLPAPEPGTGVCDVLSAADCQTAGCPVHAS